MPKPKLPSGVYALKRKAIRLKTKQPKPKVKKSNLPSGVYVEGPKVRKFRKPNLKKLGTAVGTAALAGALATGVYATGHTLRANTQRYNNAVVIEKKIQKGKLNVNAKANIRTNPNLIRETLKSYNRKAKPGQIYFCVDGKIKNVYFDQTKLEQVRRIVPEKERANIDQLIKRKVAQVEATAKSNVVLSEKIIGRVGELNYAKYLLSLTPGELSRAFPEATKAVRTALENANPKILNEIKRNYRYNVLPDYGYLLVQSLMSTYLVGHAYVKLKNRK